MPPTVALPTVAPPPGFPWRGQLAGTFSKCRRAWASLTALPLLRSGQLSQLVPGEAWSPQVGDPRACVLGLWADQDLVGAAAGQVEADGVGQVTALFVAPGWRRRYWGSRLAQTLHQATVLGTQKASGRRRRRDHSPQICDDQVTPTAKA